MAQQRIDKRLELYPYEVDLHNCEDEPIHIIQLVQTHACLLACDPQTFHILQLSQNTEQILGISHEELLNQPVTNVLDAGLLQLVKKALDRGDTPQTLHPLRMEVSRGSETAFLNLIVHQSGSLLIFEMEPYQSEINNIAFQQTVGDAIQRIQREQDIGTLITTAVQEVRRITGYDRVMMYRFDEEYNGEVIAEAKAEHLDTFLGLHYPASDIPRQARELFLKNKVRTITDVLDPGVRITPGLHPVSGAPLDLTHSVSRASSPIHLEYLENMGVGASCTIAITHDNRLWGLFACHHYSPKIVDYSLRMTCQFIGQIFSGHLALQAVNEFRQSVLGINLIKSKLAEQMMQDWNVIAGLTQGSDTVMSLMDCQGAAISFEGQIILLGESPSRKEIFELVQWLDEQEVRTVFHTQSLSKVFPAASEYAQKASGLLAIQISNRPEEYIFWFKPEYSQEVFWGGNPEKATTDDGVRLSPRKSFAKWRQKVEFTSKPWQQYEINAALALRSDIKEFALQKYREVRQLNQELSEAYQDMESFSYSVSHDLRAPLRSIDGFAQILLEDYAGQFDSYGKKVLKTIIESTEKMSNFISDLLKFSQLGRKDLLLADIDLEMMIQDIYQELRAAEAPDRKMRLQVLPPMPKIRADQVLFRHVLSNLISNAIKYSRQTPEAVIVISGSDSPQETTLNIADNGMGFDMKFKEKIFGVFSRLVHDDSFEGTGIGLSIVQRIVQRHNGRIEVHSEPGVGTTFTIYFNKAL